MSCGLFTLCSGIPALSLSSLPSVLQHARALLDADTVLQGAPLPGGWEDRLNAEAVAFRRGQPYRGGRRNSSAGRTGHLLLPLGQQNEGGAINHKLIIRPAKQVSTKLSYIYRADT